MIAKTRNDIIERVKGRAGVVELYIEHETSKSYMNKDSAILGDPHQLIEK